MDGYWRKFAKGTIRGRKMDKKYECMSAVWLLHRQARRIFSQRLAQDEDDEKDKEGFEGFIK